MAHFLDKFLGDPSKKFVKSVEPIIDEINALEKKFEPLSNTELKQETQKLREKIQTRCAWLVETDLRVRLKPGGDDHAGSSLRDDKKQPQQKRITKEEHRKKYKKAEEEILEETLPQAFALVREAGKRTIKQRHFDVQLVGGIAIHRGNIAEMKTGEGKTLAATLPVYLNALLGYGSHVITVNDYLARRDAGWMGQIYHALGLSTAAIIHDKSLIFNPKAPDHLTEVSRAQAYAADITYGTNSEFGFDYLRDNMAPAAEYLAQKELHFAVIDEVDSILIDEARTPLIISAPAEESASLYQQFAHLVPRLEKEKDFTVDEKMRTISLTSAGIKRMEEILGVDNVYSAENQQLAYHLEEALRAQILFQRDQHYIVKEGEVIIVDEFTGRLMPGRRYSEGLHQAIEAKEGVEVQRESDTLATISIQNFFRLYRKMSGMTGTASTEAEEFQKIYGMDVMVVPTNRELVRKDISDRVYKTEAGKYQAIVSDIKERNAKGQPILLGTISVEKNEYLSQLLKKNGVKHEILNAKNHEREAHIIANAGRLGAVTLATNMAGRGTDIILGGAKPEEIQEERRKKKEESSSRDDPADRLEEEIKAAAPIVVNRSIEDWQEEHNKVKTAGGLHVIGSERHESRRIDNQLRGRAGRQGDPGSTQFFISMEDDLMRIFGGDRMKNMMDRLGLPDDQPIENKMISRSIESAQKKVEGFNFDSRKHVLEYDDVMEKHRTAIYAKRRKILHYPEKIRPEVIEIIKDQARKITSTYASGNTGEWNIDQLAKDVISIIPVTEQENNKLKETINKEVSDTAVEQTVTNLFEKAYLAKVDEIGKELMEKAEQAIYLRTIDRLWVDHLNAMDELRTGIGLKGYAQTDPLVAYKQEGFNMYQRLLVVIEDRTIKTLFRIEKRESEDEPTQTRQQSLLNRAGMMQSGASEKLAGGAIGNMMATRQSGVQTMVRKVAENISSGVETRGGASNNSKKIGRNDPCYCGSGKKYKKCHGK